MYGWRRGTLLQRHSSIHKRVSGGYAVPNIVVQIAPPSMRSNNLYSYRSAVSHSSMPESLLAWLRVRTRTVLAIDMLPSC